MFANKKNTVKTYQKKSLNIKKKQYKNCHYNLFVSTDFQFVRNKKGKDLAMVKGFTYYKQRHGKFTQIWQCTNISRCRARFIITHNGEFIRYNMEHSHNPPRCVISDGEYIKI
ncbi:hypothetical protein O3G_MSEX001922 [Manduca sexta]|uniref:FLYWCH-type domain-containing protein n=1 Tax=Manduca sexta TaxID=7130 RepID=A0A921YLP4_MANSE|nr:hypothetical protein O3G_MSEX001922 [Manduca sexta]KAG6441735.1 hypothetical protein O3G_MSEX001922 [Manduca sexta]KAG6441736.1 hypothetical protein O3G_MSEX001922 [Manduca sexta]